MSKKDSLRNYFHKRLRYSTELEMQPYWQCVTYNLHIKDGRSVFSSFSFSSNGTATGIKTQQLKKEKERKKYAQGWYWWLWGIFDCRFFTSFCHVQVGAALQILAMFFGEYTVDNIGRKRVLSAKNLPPPVSIKQ